MSSYMLYFMIQMVVGVIAILFGIITINNLYKAIVNYKSKELVCANCGKEVTKDMDMCPKCKVKLK